MTPTKANTTTYPDVVAPTKHAKRAARIAQAQVVPASRDLSTPIAVMLFLILLLVGALSTGGDLPSILFNFFVSRGS